MKRSYDYHATTYEPVTALLKSISAKDRKAIAAGKASLLHRGKRAYKARPLLKSACPELLLRIEDLCLNLYPDRPKERYALFKHLGRVICFDGEAKCCPTCTKPFFGGKAYCCRSCGTQAAVKSQTWIDAHSGDNNVMRTESGKRSYKRAIVRKYGVDNVRKSVEVQARAVERCQETHGTDWTFQSESVKATIRESLLKEYGVVNNMQRSSVIASCANTWAKNYEDGHPLRDPDIFQRVQSNAYQSKPVVICGKRLMVRGYEFQVLKSLEGRISRVTTTARKMPKLVYQDGDKTRRYFPDALVETKDGRNILLEVKSEYTLRLEAVEEKAKAAWEFCRQFDNLEYMIAVFTPGSGIEWIMSLKDLVRVKSVSR